MEALVRWHHPELGRVPPSEFIPIAEETRLIGPIDAWMLETAAAQTQRWREEGHGALQVSVNASTQEFRKGSLVDTVVHGLQASGLDPSALELEITESLMIENDTLALEQLHELRSIGVRIALDDFGTGYSSLSSLTRLPLDTLKLDKAFLRDIGVDPSSEAVIVAVISLAHSLGMKIVAEGVGSQEQLDFLVEHGCEEGQGFLFSPAVPAEEFVGLLATLGRPGKSTAD